jgi:hypothetical protein
MFVAVWCFVTIAAAAHVVHRQPSSMSAASAAVTGNVTSHARLRRAGADAAHERERGERPERGRHGECDARAEHADGMDAVKSAPAHDVADGARDRGAHEQRSEQVEDGGERQRLARLAARVATSVAIALDASCSPFVAANPNASTTAMASATSIALRPPVPSRGRA